MVVECTAWTVLLVLLVLGVRPPSVKYCVAKAV